MASTDKPEFFPGIWQHPISNDSLVRHHEILGYRYQKGEEIAASTMMATAHFAAAVAYGEIRLKEQTLLMVESLSVQQTKTAAMLATMFVMRGRA